jgi:AcrR family transcriptional regulator
MVAAALSILENERPAAVSMRCVAACVDVTPMAIHHHFANCDALFEAVTGCARTRGASRTVFVRASRRPLRQPLARLHAR